MATRDTMNVHEMLRAQMSASVAQEQRALAPALAGRVGDRPAARPLSRERSFDEAKERFRGGGGAPRDAAGGKFPHEAVCEARRLYRTQVDPHELLKREMFGSHVGSCDDHFEKSRPCPSDVYGVSDHYLTLDSYEKIDTSETHRGVFRFNFMVSGETRNQSIGTRDRMSTAIAIQVGHFTTPILPYDEFTPAVLEALVPGTAELNLTANGALPTAAHLDNPMRQAACRRVTLYLNELGKQAFHDRNDKHHQFEFTTALVGRDEPAADDAVGDRYFLTPLRDYEYYVLTKPLRDVHGLTLSFFNPDEPLRFPPDTMYSVAVSTDANSLIQFRYTDPHNLINLDVGDRIFVENFEYVRHTTSAAGDVTTVNYSALNSYLNRPEGHLVGANVYDPAGAADVPFVLPAKSAAGMTVTFRLNPDIDTTTTTPAAIPAATALVRAAPLTTAGSVSSLQKTVRVRIAKNRLRIPLRIRTVVEGLTNYIAP